MVSGGAHIEQLQNEVDILGDNERRQLLLQSKPLQAQIPVDEGLKADLRIPWNEVRTLRRLHNISSTNLNRCDIPVYSWIRWVKA